MSAKKGIICPEGGWKTNTLYLVKVAFSAGNPVHNAFFFSGFTGRNGDFGGYAEVYHPSYSKPASMSEVYYMEFIDELPPCYQLMNGGE